MLCLLLSVTALAGGKSHFVSIDVPGALDTGCFSDCSTIINVWNEVTGSYLDANDVFHGFIRSPDGRLTAFDAPGADQTAGAFNGTFPNAISDAGVVTGFVIDTAGVQHGFLRSRSGRFTILDVPGYGGMTPIAINLEGAVVGNASDASGAFHAFVRQPNGTYQTFTGPGACTATPDTGCFGSGAFGINVFGETVASFEDNGGDFVDHDVLRSRNGALRVFNVPGAGTDAYQGTGCPGCSAAVNLFGAVAGIYIDAGGVGRPFVRSPWGEITTIELPGSQGIGCNADCSIALNDWGVVTGSYLDDNNVYHGFVRTPDGKLRFFDAPGADLAAGDYNGTLPISINDEGVVAGIYYDSANKSHGFVMTPY